LSESKLLPMKVHLFATDVSGLRLLEDTGGAVMASCLFIPANRRDSAKITELETAAQVPVFVHERGKALPAELPPADAAISWLYSQIIREIDLRRYPIGVLNMHGGMIPEYRGANVLQWAIIKGECELGITWHELVKEVDAGPIWAESKIAIPEGATALELRALMIEAGRNLFGTAWQRFIAKDSTPRLANLDAGRIWPSRKPEDGRIDSGWPERKVRDMVRALCAPWPAATIFIENEWVPVRGLSQQRTADSISYSTAEGREIFLLRARGDQ
jgi:methionyl-tRNA formyltransferase